MKIVVFITLFFLFSCKKDSYESNKREIGLSYENFTLKSSITYKTTEILYDDFNNTIDTFRYELKEINDTIFEDNIGRLSARIYRYKRDSKNKPWQFINAVYKSIDNFSFERIDNNKRQIKLSFPLSTDVVWNINQLNQDAAINVFYEYIHNQYKMQLFSFDSTLLIKSNKVNNPIREREYEEIYAKNIGLIFKKEVFLDKFNNTFRGLKSIKKS